MVQGALRPVGFGRALHGLILAIKKHGSDRFFSTGGVDMIFGIWAAVSGLQAFADKLSSSANNVANLNTEGFKKTRILMSAEESMGVRATAEKVNDPGPFVVTLTSKGQEMVELSNVDLGEEMPDLLVTRHGFAANLKTLQVEDEMTRNLLDIRS